MVKRIGTNWLATILMVLIALCISAGFADAQSRTLQRGPMMFENAAFNTTPWTETLAAASTLTAEDCGKTFYLAAATEFATTLPGIADVFTGCEMDFVVSAAAASANYTVVTGNTQEAIITGLITVASTHVACAAEDTVTLVDGNGLGDNFQLKSNGTNWFITGEAITSAKMTCTDET